ncbi:phage tail spike protein [Clostridium grantii]|uniref:Phage minor structural protein, N-terminal region n=1 Tax=Clostridium grantii DSM 8605 TaxID=1121316 RepID=A0A1M5U953_9CLOT|nr:phage tail spike protein [Clostridium grantii]SHH59448.1 phage minor structural protein, N-terminal region [Clostridium grantii DSM 8605]
MICIYDRKTTKGNFENNGLGVLAETISAYITEELNGDYELELEYPIKGRKAKFLEEWNIIKADGQLFRIYKVQKQGKNIKTIKVWAKHIFYDLLYFFIEDSRATNASVKTAMEKALPSDLGSIYSVDSDIIIANTIYFIEKNPVEAMFSILNRWQCGELKRDNFDIKILSQMGNNTGVLITQGKNILGIEYNIDTTEVVTKLYPVGADGIKLTEKYINVVNWDSDKYPPFPIIKKVVFSDAEDEVTLRALAEEKANTIGLNKINIEVDFIELAKTKEYEKLKDLEKVSVGDRVIVRHKDFDINITVPIIKTKKDVLRGINTTVTLGQSNNNILDNLDNSEIKTTVDELGNKVAQSLTSMYYYANPLELNIGTSMGQPIYLGLSVVSSTNLSMNMSLYCVATSECTLTIKIQLDTQDISFTPKQKLEVGDNTVGIPIGIPQVKSGAHYIGVFLQVDTGSITIPKFNLQCMIDGRNLQGGINSEPPHAECKEYQALININGLYLDKIAMGNEVFEFYEPIPASFAEQFFYDSQQFLYNNTVQNYDIFIKKFGEIIYFKEETNDDFIRDKYTTILAEDSLFFKTSYEETAVNETINLGVMFSVNLLDISKFRLIENVEVI